MLKVSHVIAFERYAALLPLRDMLRPFLGRGIPERNH
jgi:hypothetical protein